MFRQRIYNELENNSLEYRLNHLTINEFNYKKIKFWDVNHKIWIDCDDLNEYKIHKEVLSDDELIFYIYKGELNDVE